jgi:RNA polymerase sigma-70 factor (ECF subfamily)
VAAGDQAAFAELYRICERHIFYSSFDLLQSAAAASDAVQEIFIKVWVNREKLAGMDYFGA